MPAINSKEAYTKENNDELNIDDVEISEQNCSSFRSEFDRMFYRVETKTLDSYPLDTCLFFLTYKITTSHINSRGKTYHNTTFHKEKFKNAASINSHLNDKNIKLLDIDSLKLCRESIKIFYVKLKQNDIETSIIYPKSLLSLYIKKGLCPKDRYEEYTCCKIVIDEFFRANAFFENTPGNCIQVDILSVESLEENIKKLMTQKQCANPVSSTTINLLEGINELKEKFIIEKKAIKRIMESEPAKQSNMSSKLNNNITDNYYNDDDSGSGDSYYNNNDYYDGNDDSVDALQYLANGSGSGLGSDDLHDDDTEMNLTTSQKPSCDTPEYDDDHTSSGAASLSHSSFFDYFF